MTILFIICFVIIVVGKIMISGSNTSTMSTAKVVETKKVVNVHFKLNNMLI